MNGKKIIIEIEDDGTGYAQAIQAAVQVRQERQKQYGNGWTQNKEYHNVAMIMEKARRREAILLNKDTSYEKATDTDVDLINWAAFDLSKVFREEMKKNE